MPGMPYDQRSGYLGRRNSGLEEALSSYKTDHSFNVLTSINSAQARLATGQAPLVPSRHKACKLSQAPVEWIFKAKEAHVKSPCNPNGFFYGGTGSNHDGTESENDLADMVHDFMENGCCAHDTNDESNSDSGASLVPKLCEGLQAVSANISLTEREIITFITSLVLGVNESELVCQNLKTDCSGDCIRRLAVKHLRMSGYNASICKTKWQSTGKVPGGEYEYVEISFERAYAPKERVIIDLDFRCQFEIARPSQNYQLAVKSLPLIFVGKSAKLEHILQIMSEAAKSSLRQNSLHIPPWRTVEYMRAKWLSYYERKRTDCVDLQPQSLYGTLETSQCREQLKRLKAALKVEIDKGVVLKSITNGSRCVAKARRGEESVSRHGYKLLSSWNLQNYVTAESSST